MHYAVLLHTVLKFVGNLPSMENEYILQCQWQCPIGGCRHQIQWLL